jgi:hypothetical protein
MAGSFDQSFGSIYLIATRRQSLPDGEKTMRRALLWSVFAVTLAPTGTAVAAEQLKGTYAFVGTQICLTAPSGFANDGKGNPTIANGNDSFMTANNAQGLVTYNGDGTGKGTGTFVSANPPSPDSRTAAKAAMSAGTFSYSFDYIPISDNSFSVTYVPGTYRGTFSYGPSAGQQFSIDTANRTLLVSTDRKYISNANTTPYVEHITFSGSAQNSLARSCFWAGTQLRMD